MFCLFSLTEGYDCMHCVCVCASLAFCSIQSLGSFSCSYLLIFIPVLSRQFVFVSHSCNWRWLFLLFSIYLMFHFHLWIFFYTVGRSRTIANARKYRLILSLLFSSLFLKCISSFVFNFQFFFSVVSLITFPEKKKGANLSVICIRF